MTVVYDAGLLIAADRGDRRVWSDHRDRLTRGVRPLVTAPVVAQVSRFPRQALLDRLLQGCEVVAFAPQDAAGVGALLESAGTSDVVDAHVIIVAARAGGLVRTSDLGDLRHLAEHRAQHLDQPVPVVEV